MIFMILQPISVLEDSYNEELERDYSTITFVGSRARDSATEQIPEQLGCVWHETL